MHVDGVGFLESGRMEGEGTIQGHAQVFKLALLIWQQNHFARKYSTSWATELADRS